MKAYGFYGYSNTRLKVRRSLLFDQEFFARLLKANDTNKIIAALAETNYRRDIERGLVKHPGMIGVEEGLKLHLINTYEEVKLFIRDNEQAQNLVGLLLARFDLHNLKTIMRGFHSNTSKEEIAEDLIPAGELDEVLLRDLTKQLNLKACIDHLVMFKVPYARPLLQNYASYNKTGSLANLELELDKFYYDYILGRTGGLSRALSKNIRIVRDLVQRDIDMTNIMTAFRLNEEVVSEVEKAVAEMKEKEESASTEAMADKETEPVVEGKASKLAFVKNIPALIKKIPGVVKKTPGAVKKIPASVKKVPSSLRKVPTKIGLIGGKVLALIRRKPLEIKEIEKKAQEKGLGGKQLQLLNSFFIEGGKEIRREQFVKLSRLSNAEKIVEGLKRTSYYKPLKEGMKNHLITNSLAIFERKIEDFNIKKTVGLFRADPLSVGIIVAYMWAKFNEVTNLRIILRGKEVQMPEKDIKEALILV